MKDNKSEYQKIVHSFVCVTVMVSCVILIVMGIFATKNNTDALDAGIQPAMIYATRDDEAISIKIDKSVYTADELKQLPVEKILSLAPAPVGNIYLICKNAKSLIDDKFPFIYDFFA